MTKYEIIEKLINKIDELELNPVEKIEDSELNTTIEIHKHARNNGILKGLLIACDIIKSLDI